MDNWLYYALCPLVMALAWALAARLAFDRKTILLLMGSIALSYVNLYQREWVVFAPDWGFHEYYVRYIGDDFWRKSLEILGHGYLERERAFYQLPTFYIIASIFYGAGVATHAVDPVFCVFHFVMLCHIGFLLYAIRLLRLCLLPTSTAYHAALLALLYWPVSITMGARVHPDVAAYVAQMACLYYLFAWQSDMHTNPEKPLAAAILATGVAMLFKISGALYLAIVGSCLLVAIYQHRRALGKLVNYRLIGALLFAVACRVYSIYHYQPIRDVHESLDESSIGYRGHTYMFLHFNPLDFVWNTMVNPYYEESQNSFWHFFLRSLVVGDSMQWKFLVGLFAIGVVFLAMGAYTVLGIVALYRNAPRELRQRLWLMMWVTAVLLGASMAVRWLVLATVFASSARYVFPVLSMLILAFGMAVSYQQKAGRMWLVSVGSGLALGMAALSVALVLSQMVLEHTL